MRRRPALVRRTLLVASLQVALVSSLIPVACTRAHAAPPESAGAVEITGPRVGVAPDVAAALAMDTERVVVFKDGHGLFVKRATGRADANGLVYTDEVPDAAVLGSFWASHDGSVVAMRAEHVEVRTTRTRTETATTIPDLLRANVGKDVTVKLGEATDALEARIVEVLEQPTSPDAVPAGALGAEALPITLWPSGGQLVLLDTARGQLVVPVSDIRSLGGASLSTTVERSEVVAESRKRLVFELGAGAANEEVELRVIYFRPGVRWIPTYRYDDGATQGKLALQAEILNEAEDIDDANVSLVVGVPNFRFKDVVSPLVLEKTMQQTLHYAAPDIMGQGNMMSNALYTQRAMEWDQPVYEAPASAMPGGEFEAQVSGTDSHDLFVYDAGSMALARGARATLPLWRQTVGRRDLYTLELAPALTASSSNYYGSSSGGAPSPLTLSANEVWHQIEVANGADTPWTTGAALLLGEDGMPLAQELLTYTPGGSRARLPVTVAVDVRAGFSSEELDRENSAVSMNGYNLTRIESRSRIDLTNHRKEKVTVRVELSLDGRAHDPSKDGKVTMTGTSGSYAGINPRSVVTWEVELAPGASETVEVELESLAY